MKGFGTLGELVSEVGRRRGEGASMRIEEVDNPSTGVAKRETQHETHVDGDGCQEKAFAPEVEPKRGYLPRETKWAEPEAPARGLSHH
jgi:hypothetical protein